MISSDLPGVAENDASVDTFLREYDPYIVALARNGTYRGMIASSTLEDLDRDELTQQIRIKIWRALQRGHIETPQAYIKCIAHHEIIDMVRRQKPTLPLPMDEEDELYTGSLLVTPQGDMMDPASEFERKEEEMELLACTVKLVRSLPPRQRQAMISSLLERVDDPLSLMRMFKEYQVDVVESWPEDKSERLRLQASLSVARKKVEHAMGIKQSGRDETGQAPAGQRREFSPIDENEPPALHQRNEVQECAGMEAYIDHLREPYRTVVQLHYVKKHTYPQIANELNLPIGTVKSHSSRGMKMLRKLSEMGPDQKEASEQKTDTTEIVTHVGTLDEPYRTPVELHYVQKHTYPQIADELNLPKGTVKSYISRGMKMLRAPA